MMCHAFPIGDKSGKQAGQSSRHTLCVYKATHVQNETWHCPAEIFTDFLEKDGSSLRGSKRLSEIAIYLSQDTHIITDAGLGGLFLPLAQSLWIHLT